MKNWMVGLLVIGLVGFGFMLNGCEESVELPTTTTTGTIMPKVATPTFITTPGSYETNTLVVTIECETPGADIYYAIGGATASEALPKTAAASTTDPVTEEVTLRRSDSVRAFAVKEGYRNSDAITVSYDLYGWQALNGGLEDDAFTLLLTNGDLYAGGYFAFAGNYVPNTSRIAKWDGFSWSSIGGPDLGDDIYGIFSMIKAGNYLYAGGEFDALLAGVPGTNHIARWDIINSTWEALGQGVGSVPGGVVYALAYDGTYVYVGGEFSDASGVANTQGIARWNIAGQAWEALGTGLSGAFPNCRALYLHGGYLYAGGYVDSFSGVANTKNIARWNIATENWEALGNGLNDGVSELYHDGTHLYAGGYFTQENGSVTPLNQIAKWDGAAWSAVGNGSDNNMEVSALAGYGNYIYAGGDFETMSGVPGTLHIARWDKINSTWEAVGAGLVGDEIEKLICDAEGNLYFGGDDISGDPSGGVGLLNIGKRGKIE